MESMCEGFPNNVLLNWLEWTGLLLYFVLYYTAVEEFCPLWWIGHLVVERPQHQQYFALNSCYHHCLRAKGSKTKDPGKASIVQGTLFLPICTFICQDQLLVLAVFLSCPLERGGSQLERGARGDALSPLCVETHGGLERLGAGAERKSEREHT